MNAEELNLSSIAQRKRGRPLEMPAEHLVRRIRDHSASGLLFRVHHEAPALYARARRMFGTWAGALSAAGLDHAQALREARRRSFETRRRLRSEDDPSGAPAAK